MVRAETGLLTLLYIRQFDGSKIYNATRVGCVVHFFRVLCSCTIRLEDEMVTSSYTCSWTFRKLFWILTRLCSMNWCAWKRTMWKHLWTWPLPLMT